jgi:hypothetical protein
MFLPLPVTTMVCSVLTSMPLLPELGCGKDGLCSKHDAPKGAMRSG